MATIDPNILLPGQLQDGVTYDVVINSIVDGAGNTLIGYTISSGGILLVDIPPTRDNNVYIDKTKTGVGFQHFYPGPNGSTPVPGWNIQITDFSVSWEGLTTTYSITPNKTSVNEGDSVTYNIVTENVPDGTILYLTNSGTTDSNDWYGDLQVTINNNRASVTHYIMNDLQTEGPETIILRLRTGSPSGTVVATAATVTVNDTSTEPVSATYSISPSAGTVNEGQTVTWTVNTANVPDGTVLYWTNSGTTDATDFTDNTGSGSFVINSNVGTFSKTLFNDLKTEGVETITMAVRTGGISGPIVAISSVVNVVDTSTAPIDSTPVYSIAPSSININEGDSVTFNVTTVNVPNGTTLYYDNIGTVNEFDFLGYFNGGPSQASGSFTITNGRGSFTKTIRNDALTEGSETIIMRIRTGASNGPVVATSDTVTVNDTSVPTSPDAQTYSIIPSSLSINEGETVSWFISTSNIQDGTLLYWTNAGTTKSDDFSDPISNGVDRQSGSVAITTNIGVFNRTLVSDLKTEGPETIIMQLRTGSIAGPIVAVSAPVTVRDTSTGPPSYAVTPNKLIVKEGELITYRVDTLNVPLNTILYWTADGVFSNVDFEDFVDYAVSGTVAITNSGKELASGFGTFSRRLSKDNFTEGSETMIIRIRKGSITGPIVATAVPVTVTDTSKTPIIKWEKENNLGTLTTGEISEFYVRAIFSTSTVYVKYSLDSGQLPPGLVLERDGSISGRPTVNTLTTSTITTSTFIVKVSDTNNNSLLTGTFAITVLQPSATEFTQMYARPFLSQSKRREYINFIRNESIFDPSLIYRPFDSNFGKQEELKLHIHFGVKKLTMLEYANILSKNFYKRKFMPGSLKVGVAKDADGNVLHEIIYVDILDKHLNSNRESVPQTLVYNGVTYYPPSVNNMRLRISTSTEVSSMPNPRFLKTVQPGDAVKLEYIPYIPICFTLPGKSATIIRKIEESELKFNTFDLEIDKVIVNDVIDQQGNKYLLLSRDTNLA